MDKAPKTKATNANDRIGCPMKKLTMPPRSNPE